MADKSRAAKKKKVVAVLNKTRSMELQAIFPFDVEQKDDAIVAYNQFLLVCCEIGDSTSMKILEAVFDDE